MATNSLWRAAAEGNAKLLRELLTGQHSRGRAKEQQINVRATNAQGQTLLHVAVLADSPECVSLLIDHAAAAATAELRSNGLYPFLNHRDTSLGWTALHHAIFRKHTTAALLLAARGAEIDVLDHKGYSPVDLAFVNEYPPPAPNTCPVPPPVPSSRTRGATSDSDAVEIAREYGDEYDEEEAEQEPYFSGPDEWSGQRLAHLARGHVVHEVDRSNSRQASSVKSETEVLGELFTWGEGSNYCLGHGNPNSASQPKRVTSLPSDDSIVVQVSTSEFATGIVTQSGRLYTCGVGTTGRLGHGDREIRLVPKRVIGALQSKRIIAVSMGYAHAAAVADDGSIFTWGSGEFGQLGHDSTEDSLVPKKVSGAFDGQKAIAVSAGRHHTAVLTSKGAVWTFGHGEHGELGYLTDSLAKKAYCQTTPRVVAGIEAAVQSIAVGKTHTACATHSGDVYLFGLGSLHPRKLFLPNILPSTFVNASSSSTTSKQDLLPTPIFTISPTHTSFSLLSDGRSASASSIGPRTNRTITSLAACGNMTLVVCNRRDAFLSDLYHVEGAHSRLPKPTLLPPIPGNNTIASVALSTTKEILASTGAGHLWKCAERKTKEWEWHRISVRRFTQVACSRSHFAAIGQKEAVIQQSIEVSPWNLSSHLLKELEASDFTDVEFLLDDGTRVPAHKIVLARRSQHFHDLFVTSSSTEASKPPQRTKSEGLVWGEHDFGVDLLFQPKQKVVLSQVTSQQCNSFLRLMYSDSSNPHMPRLKESERLQAAPVLKRFGVKLTASSRDKGKGKAKDDHRTADSSSKHGLSLFEQDLRGALFDETLTDVELISCEGGRIPCHKVIICSQSEVLRAMMTIGMIESLKSEVCIQNAKTSTLKKVKEFLYLGTFAELTEGGQRPHGTKPSEPSRDSNKKGAGSSGALPVRELIPFDTVMELLNISNQFMILRMKETLEDLLLRQYLDYDNFMSLLITAENFSCYNLKRELFAFARRNFIALLMSNVARELTDANQADYAYLLDDMQHYIQHGWLREEGPEEYSSEEEILEDIEINELLNYLTEEELQHQQEMESFWDKERQIAKERERAKANEQRRRLAKARAKAAAKARSRNRLRNSQSAAPAVGSSGGQAEEASEQTNVLSPEKLEAREKARAQIQAAIELANGTLACDYEGNEEATRHAKRLRAAKKKLSQIDALRLKQDQGVELDEGQLAKLEQEQALRTEIESLVVLIAEANRPKPKPKPSKPQPQPQPASQVEPHAPEPEAWAAPSGPVAYKKKPETDDFFGKPATQPPNSRNRRRSNSSKKTHAADLSPAVSSAPPPSAHATTASSTPVPKTPAAPWATPKPQTVSAAEQPAAIAQAASPQRAVSLLEIQQEQARAKPTGHRGIGPQQQQRTVKRLGGALEKEVLRPPQRRQQQQVGSADNESSSGPYALSLVIGGKSATSPVRLAQPAIPSSSSSSTSCATSPLRASGDGSHPQRSPAKASPSRTPAVRAAPSSSSHGARTSLADIQREEQQRIEAERKRREVVKPTKKSLQEIQNEQEEARRVKALYGEELKLIYGPDVDIESVW